MIATDTFKIITFVLYRVLQNLYDICLIEVKHENVSNLLLIYFLTYVL